jgi:hypothetical protein
MQRDMAVLPEVLMRARATRRRPTEALPAATQPALPTATAADQPEDDQMTIPEDQIGLF